jgi:peptidoglycan/xylan/chitin deacetylase (PgdA/CDA1 family)
MDRNRAPYRSPNRRTASVRALVVFCFFSLAVVFSLLSTMPVRGRWEVPQVAETVERSDSPPDDASSDEDASSSSEGGIPSPSAQAEIEREGPTPAVLPDQARVPILMYHYVSELPPNADRYRVDLTVSPENFKAQLQYLADAGYHTITLTDLYLHLTQGYPLPEKPIVLTFDDGYMDAYEVVFPMLLDHGFTGTFFVLATPAHFESPGYMTWAQMNEMADAGMEIQAHGRDHVDLRGRSYDYLVYQILGIQEAIEHHTGRLPRFFCYPSGKWDASVVAVLKSAGYWGAVTTEWGQTQTQESLFEMPRVRIRGTDRLASFIDRLED